MVIRLTETGWETEVGEDLGLWTENTDYTLEGKEDRLILNADVEVRTGGGSDYLLGVDGIGDNSNRDSGSGIAIGRGLQGEAGILKTEDGNDVLVGTARNSRRAIGIHNRGIIDTGKGKDFISGNATPREAIAGNINYGIINDSLSTISTGEGNDSIFGRAKARVSRGIANYSDISTGEGDDSIIGIAEAKSNGGVGGRIGIRQTNLGTIDMGDGEDLIRGEGRTLGIENPGSINIGIENGGVINMGKGNDTVDALTGGFSRSGISVGTVNLGKGEDLILGYGEQIVDGGEGYDTAMMGINKGDAGIFISGASGSTVDLPDVAFSGNSEEPFKVEIGTMTFINVEQFIFNDFVISVETIF